MKRKYIIPDAVVVEIKSSSIICVSQITGINDNADLDLFGGGDVPGRSHEAWFSDDEWFEE